MSDDLANLGQRDKARIDLSQDYARRDWARNFGITEDELTDAVQRGGDSADKVRDYLQVKDFIKRLNDYVKQRKPASPA
jgi:hypothetical protein